MSEEDKTFKIVIEVTEDGLSIESKVDMLLTLNVLSNAVATVTDDMIEKSIEAREKFSALLEEAEKEILGEEEETIIQ